MIRLRSPQLLGLLILAPLSGGEAIQAAEPTGRVATPVKLAPATVTQQGAWYVGESANFQVCSLQSAAEAATIADGCEQLRSLIATLCDIQAQPWTPRCQIVLHPNSTAYVAAVGGAGKATIASAITRRASDRIQLRKIDVRGDVNDFLWTALPHELCHVLLADRFVTVPLWCDEGLAILLDPLDKQQLHDRDLQTAIRQMGAMPLEEIFSLRHYPRAEEWALFYGQSASLARHLLQQGTPRQLLQFAELQQAHGAKVALRDVYGINGLAELQRQWQPAASSPNAPLTLLPKNLLNSSLLPLAETP